MMMDRVLLPWVASTNRRSSLASSFRRFIGEELGVTMATTLSAATVFPKPMFNRTFSIRFPVYASVIPEAISKLGFSLKVKEDPIFQPQEYGWFSKTRNKDPTPRLCEKTILR
jgi:hypothetical protein